MGATLAGVLVAALAIAGLVATGKSIQGSRISLDALEAVAGRDIWRGNEDPR